MRTFQASPSGATRIFAFSPTASRWCSRRASPAATEPWSTNFDLFQTPVDGSAAPANLTASNPA